MSSALSEPLIATNATDDREREPFEVVGPPHHSRVSQTDNDENNPPSLVGSYIIKGGGGGYIQEVETDGLEYDSNEDDSDAEYDDYDLSQHDFSRGRQPHRYNRMSMAPKQMKRFKAITGIATLVMIFLIIIGLVLYPLIYFVNFLTQPEKSETIFLTPYAPKASFIHPNFVPPYVQAIVNITTPLNARFMLFSFSANATVQAAVIRKQAVFETFMDLAEKTALSLNPMSSFIFEKPLDRSNFVISAAPFGTRFFSVQVLNNSGMYDEPEKDFNFTTNSTISRNTTTIYMVWRNTDNSLAPIEFKYWYWLEFDDNRHLKAFTGAAICISIAVILISIVILNTKTTTLVIYYLVRSLSPSGRRRFLNDIKHLPTTSRSELKERDVLWTRGADITYFNLTFTSFSGKTILHPTSGILQSGRFTAIMGPSGSGKSTFVNSLCKRASNGKQSGKILIDNREITEETSKIIGFVTQDDTMAPHMTVRETLEFSITYRKNRMFNKKERISAILDRLGLSKVQHSLTKVCSGGEKRRTSIGIELCADTPVLILDEPTSGLDSETALSLCQTLRELAEKCNLNIICVIHQPSLEILKQFHDIMLFSEGRVLFHAPVSTVVNVLKESISPNEIRNNPADEILRTLIAPQGEFIVDAIIRKTQEYVQERRPSRKKNLFELVDGNDHSLMENSSKRYSTRAVYYNNNNTHDSDAATMAIKNNKSKHHNISAQAYRTAPFFVQFIVCFWRCFKQFYRDWVTIIIENVICLGIGILIGQIFKGLHFAGAVPESLYMQCPISLRGNAMIPQSDIISPYATFFNIAISLVSIMRGLLVFGNDMNNFKRECYSGLNSWMYYLAKDLVSMIVVLILSLSFTIGLQVASPQTNFGILWMVIFATMLASFPIGYIISYFFTPHTAQLAASLVVMIFFAISGNQPSIPEMETYSFPFTYIHVISYLKYVKGLIFMIELETRRGKESLNEVLKIYGFEIEALSYYVYALIFWIIVWRFISIYCLWAWKPRSLFSKVVYFLKFIFGNIYGRISNAGSTVKLTMKRRMSSKILQNPDEMNR
ncbi:hypothetical protein C9374_008991 [Naegleria lovaniensis]|uniref:ABC transporter domain-containing protein n=1 Tax=Naegleria lovaniensis TaxID=51637 RepID=A0AA88KH76_NAELO|nr:uncharacterized protein C9374_008991 [Naegleria lovaniensis]KAG2377906.1 hypothetical protein C9374_008991 [Naegleria lovaniensis]